MPTKSQHKEEMQTCPFCRGRKKVRVGVVTCGKTKCDRQAEKLTKALRIADTPDDMIKSHRLERDVLQLKRQQNSLIKQMEESDVLNRIADKVMKSAVTSPVWGTKKRRTKGPKPSFFCVSCSDWHMDEVVRPEAIDGLNAYNREIAVKRYKTFFRNIQEVATDYLSELEYDSLLFAMVGDMFSGIIHEELRETNESTMFESLLFWRDLTVAGLNDLLDVFPKIKIPCVVGNHGRTTIKPQFKMYVEKNLDWLFTMLVADKMDSPKHKSRIEWQIPRGREIRYKIYDTQFTQLHGDTFRGGSGIAAALSPMLLGNNRKALSAAATGRIHQNMVIGHWHTLIPGVYGIFCNGSGKGYDEFASGLSLRYEEPQQLFWITDQKYGVTIRGPIHCKAKNENWKKKPDIIWGDRTV